MLDGNGSGRITSDEIELDHVPGKILLTLKPLLIEMEAYDESLDEEEFIESVLNLLNQFTIEQRNDILHFQESAKRGTQANPLTFKPRISKHSKELAKLVNEL